MSSLLPSLTGIDSATSSARPSTSEAVQPEFIETRSVTLEWKVSGLKHLFESSKGDAKSKCVKSALFDNHRWQIFLYPNSGHEQYCSLYLSCEPTAEEKEKGRLERVAGTDGTGSWATNSSHRGPAAGGVITGSGKDGKGPWKREGRFRFTFEARSIDKRMTFKQMEANDHSFSDTARNWGYANFWKRSDAFYNNPTVRVADAFLIVCTIVYSPTGPSPPPLPRLLIPKDLVSAYASLFDDPDYSDIVFRIRPSARPNLPERRLYAAKKVLAGRCEYFETMFNSGFNESCVATASSGTNSPRPQYSEEEVDYSSEDDWDEDDDTDENYDDEQTTAEHDREPVTAKSRDADNTENSSSGSRPVFKREISSSSASGIDAQANARPSSAAVSDDEETQDRVPPAETDDETEEATNSPDRNKREAERDANSFVDAPTAPDSPTKTSGMKRQSTITSASVLSRAAVPAASQIRRAGAKAEDSRPRFEVVVTDAGYNSYRALLNYLYTDSIQFAPLASSYHVARDAALQANLPFPFTSRKHYLLQATPWPQSQERVGPCSAKAIYRLADKLGLPELKERAYEHIVKSLTVENIVYEVFGSFSSRFEEIQKIQVAFLLEKWNEIKAGNGLKKVFQFIRTSRFPAFEEVWSKILPVLEVKVPANEIDERV